MNQLPTLISLTEAITTLALGEALSASELRGALVSGRLGKSRSEVFDLADTEAKTLCDAGFRGEISCWGIRVTGDQCAEPNTSGKKALLEKGDFLNYRQYLLGVDALWLRNAVPDTSPDPDASLTEFVHAFAAFEAADYIRNVEVVQQSFEKFRMGSTNPVRMPFTPEEREKWIMGWPGANCDNAFKSFKDEHQWDGTKQNAFRLDWKRLRTAKLGRPRIKS